MSNTPPLPAPVDPQAAGLLSVERLNEIRARLAACPGLPWEVDEQYQQVWSPGTRKYIGTEGTKADPEIAFIINAADDMVYLLSLLEESRRYGVDAINDMAFEACVRNTQVAAVLRGLLHDVGEEYPTDPGDETEVLQADMCRAHNSSIHRAARALGLTL